jgi:hypothetical protein
MLTIWASGDYFLTAGLKVKKYVIFGFGLGSLPLPDGFWRRS